MLENSEDTASRPQISPIEYKAIGDFLSQSCGIVLEKNKQDLVQHRLSFLLKKFDLSDFSELVNSLQSEMISAQRVKTAVIDSMITNETFWFRDGMQFKALTQKIFPELFKQKTGTIKIWSAACSSGQEPYTLSMCAEDAIREGGKGRNIQIIGTDISETVISEAKKAVYPELALSRGLEASVKERFFEKTHEGFKLKPEICNKVRFQQFNLLKPFSVLGRFDVIFCRNVLIYFSDEVKRDILTRMARALEPGGYIFLSSTESMPIDLKEFETIKGGVRYYKKVG